MGAVLLIINLLHKISAQLMTADRLNCNQLVSLFSMLCLNPNLSHSKSEDLQFLLSFIPTECYKPISDALIYFTNNYLLDLKIEWLYVIPLIHIFKKRVHPFENPVYDKKYIKWTDEDINLYLLKGNPAAATASR